MFGSFVPSWDKLQQWGQQGAVSRDSYQEIFESRKMDQRSRISFHYPKAEESEKDTIVFLPFYENPTITETQAANYGTYNIIGRGSSLFSYLGSSSRKIKVSMHFTLPHLAMHDMGIARFMRVYANAGKKAKQSLFLDKYAQKGDETNTKSSLAHAVQAEYLALAYPDDPVAGDLDSLVENPATNSILSNVIKAEGIGEPSQMIKIVDTLLFFISLLRTSVVNNASNPMQGPPLLRLSFGTLYQAVPCICKSYNLSWDEDAGYHLETLTPRRLKIDLVLEEVRVGNFGAYDAGTYIERDNLAGWEASISAGNGTTPGYTTDPLNVVNTGTPR